MAHIVVTALDLTAATLAEGKPLPGQAGVLTARPFIPPLAYLPTGDLG